jgi:hypothetical protein
VEMVPPEAGGDTAYVSGPNYERCRGT